MKKLFMIAAILALPTTINAASSYAFTDLSPNSTFAEAHAINNLGEVVGFQYVPIHVPGTPYTFGYSTATIWNGATGSQKFLSTPSIYSESVANDINESSQVVGYSYDSNMIEFKSSLWENDQTKSLPSPGMTYGRAYGINESGEIIGITGIRDSSRLLTLWDNKLAPTVMGKTGWPDYSINDSGQIAGDFEFSPLNFNGGIWKDGVLTDIGSLGGGRTYAYDINNLGMVTGVSSTPDNGRAFIYDGDTMTALRMIPGYGGYTVANAINDLGQVVGYSVAAMHAFQHATLWNGYQVYDLNDFLDMDSKNAGWVLTDALDINDHGWIVGEAVNTFTGEKHAFLLSSSNPITPVPEPTTYAMLLAGLGLIGFMAYRRKSMIN